MPNKDYELERINAEIEAAKREIADASSRLDSINYKRQAIKSQIDSVTYRINDLKRSKEMEYSAMKLCYERRDKIDAENHKYRMQSFGDSLQRVYAEKNSLYEQLNIYKPEYESALSQLRSAKARKNAAYERKNARLALLKSQNAERNAKWHTKSCARCGREIRYHEDWNHIPNICKDCKEKKNW